MSRISFSSLLALVAVALVAVIPASAGAKRGNHHKSAKAKKVRKADRNRDGLPDRWERRHRLSLRVNQAGRDQDRDGRNNAAEFTGNTNPRDADSDDDGIKDGAESTIGTIVSFENGTLVISSGGLPVSGKVTDATEIKCEHEHGDHGRHRGEGHEGDDDAHSSSRGDDDGDGRGGDDDGPGHDVGDDHTHGGMPTGGGMPTAGGMPTGGGMPPAPVCTIADLKPGAAVHEAELKLTVNGPVWDEIELVPAAPPVPAVPAG